MSEKESIFASSVYTDKKGPTGRQQKNKHVLQIRVVFASVSSNPRSLLKFCIFERKKY